jgi:DNA polymerase-3 subunit delta'
MHKKFDHLIGNEHIKDYLVRMVENHVVANSLLFAGPSGIGKSLFAEAFAKMILDVDSVHHPDIYQYHPEGKVGMHSIDSMRKFSEEVYLPPYQAKWKVFIIHDADRMLPTSANALLKTFEEPAPKSIIILVSGNPEALLPTLLSRCRTLRFHSVEIHELAKLLQTKYQKNPLEAETIAIQSKGSVGNAFRMAEEGGDPLRLQVLEILSKGKLSNYTQLIEVAKTMSDQVESLRQEMEEEMRASTKNSFPEGLTSVQQQAIDKEIDGALAMLLSLEAQKVFDVILSWYRDMYLQHLGGNPTHLFHPDFSEQSKIAMLRGEMLPLEDVQKYIFQAKLSLDRSTSFQNCLENLFLQLNLL